ncbi:MAG: SDR family oxidoreductase [Planctomycetota bacterium JB042]
MSGDAPGSRTAVVTGAASGIGAATLARFRAAGWTAWGLDLATPDGRDADPCFATVDVTDRAALEAAFARAAAATGRLDAVVACAGINRDGVLWKLSEEDWRRVLAVNLDGSFHAIAAALPHQRPHGRGAIVLVTSINGERGAFGQTNYAASKAGVIGLTKSAAREVGRFGIRVNAVSPGYIDTPMTRPLPTEIVDEATRASLLGRIGEPDEVAAAITWLCSDDASYVTGQVLRVDGGQHL